MCRGGGVRRGEYDGELVAWRREDYDGDLHLVEQVRKWRTSLVESGGWGGAIKKVICCDPLWPEEIKRKARRLLGRVWGVDEGEEGARLVEVNGPGKAADRLLLTANERRVAEDRRDCYWLYVLTDCRGGPRLYEVRDRARFPWHEVTRVDHYWLEVDALRRLAEIREDPDRYQP